MDAKINSSFAAKIKNGVRNMRSTFNILFYVKFEDDNLAFVRDIFAFVCFTALSFIDVKNLTTDRHQWRQVDHQQASQNQHPLSGETDGRTLADYRPLQALTGRQTGFRQDALDLWSLGSSKNYWSMCKKLKTVMTACGIEKTISYHCGRHSFATLALSKKTHRRN